MLMRRDYVVAPLVVISQLLFFNLRFSLVRLDFSILEIRMLINTIRVVGLVAQ